SPVVYKGLRVALPDGEATVDLTVKPYGSARGVHVLVMLQAGPAPRPAPSHEIDLNHASRHQNQTLETDLRYAEANLQARIEEMETSNEELHSVNAEYQHKIAELTRLTSDMDNLLSSTQVHTIFLDRELCIRKFTPMIAETFNLMPQDVGRRIDNFTY